MHCTENYFLCHQFHERNTLKNFGAPTKWWDQFYSTVQNLPINWVLSMMQKWNACMKSCVVFGTGTGVPPQKKNARKKLRTSVQSATKASIGQVLQGEVWVRNFQDWHCLTGQIWHWHALTAYREMDSGVLGENPWFHLLYCMYLINHSRLSVSPFEKGDNHKLILHLTMLDDCHYMQWWGKIATYSPFITTSWLYTYST